MQCSYFDRIPVVTVFLHRRGRVLLFRRSERVGTYRGKWAGVSGYVERVPLEQAFVEVQEETGLAQEDIRLRSIGVPIPVDDDDQDRHWLVYPFLLTIHPRAKVQPNWESVETCWVKPEEIGRLETVPGLQQVFESVWPPFGSTGLWRAAQQIAGDRTSGATALAMAAVKALGQFCKSREAKASSEAILRAARALASLRPSMGVIPHIMCLAVGAKKSALPAELRAALATATDRSAQNAAAAICRARCVLTHSASSACEAAILAWAQRAQTPQVIVTESRPKLEGVGLAKRLARSGMNVRLITDAQLGLAVREADAVVVGADAITDDDQLLNKAGTRLAIMAARECGTRAYAICQTHKICPPGWPIALERQEPNDVCASVEVQAQNVAFDATPLAWFSAVITEQGRLTPQILERSRRKLARSAFIARA